MIFHLKIVNFYCRKIEVHAVATHLNATCDTLDEVLQICLKTSNLRIQDDSQDGHKYCYHSQIHCWVGPPRHDSKDTRSLSESAVKHFPLFRIVLS